MKKSMAAILYLLILANVSACTTINKFKVVLPASWFDMEALTDGVYVNAEMEKPQRQLLLTTIDIAREQTIGVWGSLEAAPDVFACSTEACFKQYGGSTNRANAIGSTAIILSPRALNAALISHELSHAELYERIDSLSRWRDVPQWFDEGVAVLVSDEASHSEEVFTSVVSSGISPPALNELVTLRQWIDAVHKYREPNINPDQYGVVYATAGHEVRAWFEGAGKQGLLRLVQEVNRGEDFLSVYNAER